LCNLLVIFAALECPVWDDRVRGDKVRGDEMALLGIEYVSGVGDHADDVGEDPYRSNTARLLVPIPISRSLRRFIR